MSNELTKIVIDEINQGDCLMEIKLNATRTEHVNVTVSKRELIDKVVKLILSSNNLHKDYFLSNNGKEIRKDDDHYHGSVTDSLVRKASKKDKEAFKIIKYLENL